MIDLTYKLKSEVCLSPNTCYPVNTEIPAWMILILLGSSVLLLKELYKLLNN
jgi:hypothetical protein